MAKVLLVAADGSTGKTAIAAGLAKHYADAGKKVGYIKIGDAADAEFLKKALGDSVAVSSAADTGAAKKAIGSEDVILVEGAADDAATLGAGIVFVADYNNGVSGLDKRLAELKGNISGIIVNRVPARKLEGVCNEVTAQTKLPLLAVLPEARALTTISVGELAEAIGGRIMNNPEKADELVESVMLGAMVVDSGLDYFGRKAAKAAIVRADKPDMQLASLETDTRCLVLTGAADSPVYNVAEKAQVKGIPAVLAAEGTESVIKKLENALGAGRFRQIKKMARIAELISRHADEKALSGLGA